MGFSPVEIDVHRLMEMVADGRTNAELCVAFDVSERTLTRWRMRNPDINDRILATRGVSPSKSRKPKDRTKPHRPSAGCFHKFGCPQEACRRVYNNYQNGRRRVGRHPARPEIEHYIALGWSPEGIAAKLAAQGVTVEVVCRTWACWDREVGVTSMPPELAALAGPAEVAAA
jgi:hypothetical protein